MEPELLDKATGCGQTIAGIYAPFITEAMLLFGIDSAPRQAAFLAQVAHESGSFTRTVENLNYGLAGLLAVFPKHFTSQADAIPYQRNPEKIANRVYCNRMGNGNEVSGDGWKYRGRGLMQLTGKDDYAACGAAIGLNLVNLPDQLAAPRNAALSAGWEWRRGNLNALADLGDFTQITQVINGGQNGAADRVQRWALAKAALAVV